jgi:hypothetical protein
MITDTNGRVLILSDGGMPALIAAMHAREACSLATPGAAPEQIAATLRDRVLLMPFGLRTETRLLQSRAVTQQATLLGLGLLGVEVTGKAGEEIKPLLTVAPHADADEREGCELFAALLLAARLQCARIVWPAHAGGHDSVDLDRLSQIADRALVAGQYAGLCSSARIAASLHLETPFADLTDRQLADLAIDIDAPVDACWWWNADKSASERAGEERKERTRWIDALRAMGWAAFAGAGA